MRASKSYETQGQAYTTKEERGRNKQAAAYKARIGTEHIMFVSSVPCTSPFFGLFSRSLVSQLLLYKCKQLLFGVQALKRIPIDLKQNKKRKENTLISAVGAVPVRS